MAEQDQNRSEQATPHKLLEAKKKGSVAKSAEVNSLVIIAGFVAFLYLWGEQTVSGQLRLHHAILSQAHLLSFSPAQILAWLDGILTATLLSLAPFLLVLLVLGVVSNLMQTGPIFTVFPLKPDFNRLNPATGFKRLFSLRVLYEGVKTVVKLVLFCGVLSLAITSLMGPLLGMQQTDPGGYPKRVLDDLAGVLFKLVMAMLAVALLDVLYTRREFAKKMMMSVRELKDEIKQREGDPRIKARITQLQNELRKRSQAMRNVPKSDVLITNPTHLAVAVAYKHGEMLAPQIVAKGAGSMVEKMKRVARRHRIPIVENKTLARALFRSKLESAVPQASYADVARILVWVYAQRDARARREKTQ